MLDPYAPYGGQNSAYPPSSLYSSSSSTPLPPMTPAVAPTAAGANPAHHAMSPLSDPDADASTDDSESYPVQARPLAGLNGDKINLQAVDPDLYGLRRSVSRSLRSTYIVLTARHRGHIQKRSRDTVSMNFQGHPLCAYLSVLPLSAPQSRPLTTMQTQMATMTRIMRTTRPPSASALIAR